MSADLNTANFPGPNAPIDQDGQVILSQPWFQFFLSLLARTSGNGTPPSNTSSLLAAVKAVQAQADFQSVVFSVRLDAVEALFLNLSQPDLRAILARLDEHDARLLDLPVSAASPLEQWNAPTLINSWGNLGAPFNAPGYWKDTSGVVHLRGAVKSGAVGSDIFILPAGYRPANTEILACVSNGAFGVIEILSGGNVNATVGNNAYFSMDGLTFRAA